MMKIRVAKRWNRKKNEQGDWRKERNTLEAYALTI
jgi:hypothetical protein